MSLAFYFIISCQLIALFLPGSTISTHWVHALSLHQSGTNAIITSNSIVNQNYYFGDFSQFGQTASQHKLSTTIDSDDIDIDNLTEVSDYSPNTVHILVPANEQFIRKYHLTIDTLRCYAKKFGYTFSLIDPLDNAIKTQCSCLRESNNHNDQSSNSYYPGFSVQHRVATSFFFQKHCMVSCYLENNGPAKVAVAVIFDADTLSANLDYPLDFWLNKLGSNSAPKNDLLMYKRCQFPEVMAGNYMVRNSPASIAWLRGWSELWRHSPPGFSSADNGALHMHLLRVIGANGMQNFDGTYAVDKSSKIPKIENESNPCALQYRNLTALSDNLEPYFAFSRCALKDLGLGDWQQKSTSDNEYPKFSTSESNGIRFVGMKTFSQTSNFLSGSTGSNSELTSTKKSVLKNKFSFVIFYESRAWVHDYTCGGPKQMLLLSQPRPVFFHGVKNEYWVLSYWNVVFSEYSEMTTDSDSNENTCSNSNAANNVKKMTSVYPKCSIRKHNYGINMENHKCVSHVGQLVDWKCMKKVYESAISQ